MTTLLDLLSSFPILEAILSVLPLGSLLGLSKVNSDYRAVLHGFSFINEDSGLAQGTNIRLRLHIGEHQTGTWRHYKSISQLECSERHHTRGENVRGCRVCSMPVCEACIVKSSFGKRENTFQARARRLCKECWAIGNPHAEKLQPDVHAIALLDYDFSEICRCTARDGTLCLGCKEHRNSEYIRQLACCIGYSCTNDELDYDTTAGRICLWCDRILPGRRSREDRRKEYNLRDLLLPNCEKQHEETTAAAPPLTGRLTSFDDQRWTMPRENQAGPSSIQLMEPELQGLREVEHHVEHDQVCENEGAEACVDSNGDNIIADEVNDQTYTTQPESRMIWKSPEEDFVFVYHDDVEMLVSHTEAGMTTVSSEE